MRPGFELGLAMQEICRKQPDGQGHHDGPARLHLLGRRRQGNATSCTLDLIEKAAQLSSKRSTRTRAATHGVRRRKISRPSRRKSAAKLFAAILPWLRGQVSAAKAFHRHRAGRRNHPALRQFSTTRRAWPNSAPAAPTISCAPRSSRSTSDWNPQTGDLAALKKKLAAGLEQYRKDYAAYYDTLQARRLARHARPEPDRRPHSRPRHDRLGQGQERIARDRRILQLRRRGHARRGGDRRIYRAAAAGSLRHRILAAGGSQAQAHAGGEGTGAAGDRRGRRRQRHRPGNRAPARQGRRARRLRRSQSRRPAKATAKEITDQARPRASAWRAAGISGCGPAIGLAANITHRDSIRAMLDQVVLAYGGFDSICVTAGIFVPPRHHRPYPRRKMGARPSRSTSPAAYLVADEAAQDLEGAGAARQPGAHHQRQRRRGQEGQSSPTTPARPRRTTSCANSPWNSRRSCASTASRRPRSSRAAPCSRATASSASLAKYKIPYTDDEPTESLVAKARAVLRRPHADQDTRSRPPTRRRPIFLLLGQSPEQNHRPGHHRRRRPARGVFCGETGEARCLVNFSKPTAA